MDDAIRALLGRPRRRPHFPKERLQSRFFSRAPRRTTSRTVPNRRAAVNRGAPPPRVAQVWRSALQSLLAKLLLHFALLSTPRALFSACVLILDISEKASKSKPHGGGPRAMHLLWL